MEIQAIHHTVSLLQSHQTWRVPTPSLIIYPGVIDSDAGGLLMFQVSYLDWFPVLQNLIYKLIVQKTQSSLSLISRRLYMLSLRWDKDTSRRTDLITGKGRHPLSVLALTASSTYVFLTNTSKLLTPNCIIDLVPKTPACLATLPESCLWRKYTITPETGELLGEFRIWCPYILWAEEREWTRKHVSTPNPWLFWYKPSLWAAILEMREIAHGYICFTGLTTSCLIVNVFFFIQTLQFSCVCSLSFFQRVHVECASLLHWHFSKIWRHSNKSNQSSFLTSMQLACNDC